MLSIRVGQLCLTWGRLHQKGDDIWYEDRAALPHEFGYLGR